MADPIADELRGLAGTGLYRRNAFRMSGLVAGVDRRTTRQVVQRLRAALEVGADVDLGPTASRDPDEIRGACDLILGDPRRRLVHEVFARWGNDVEACGCTPAFHDRHDNAVDIHAKAIQGELDHQQGQVELDKLWTIAGKAWTKVLAGKEFGAHLASRVLELDDRQLTASAVEQIRSELSRTLIKPCIDLAVAATANVFRHADHAQRFPDANKLADRMLETAAGPLYDDLEERRTSIGRRIQDEDPDTIVDEIERELLPRLTRLDSIVPPKRHRRTADLHDQIAILLNNCAVKLLDRGEVSDGRADEWLNRAAGLVIDPRDAALVQENRQMLRESAKAMADFRGQVYLLYTMRGSAAAKAMLRQVRREIDAPSVRAEIDRMLAEISAGNFQRERREPPRRPPSKPASRQGGSAPRSPSYSKPKRPGGRWRGPVLLWLLVAAAIVFGVVRWGPFGQEVSVYQSKVADNAEPGPCLDKQADDWLAKATELKGRDCDKPHWGEVLGYVQLTKVPAAYPGNDQAAALATFQCGEMLIQQGLKAADYDISEVYAGAQYWNTGKDDNEYENYASCVLHRKDGQEIPAGQKVKPEAPATPKAVAMDLYADKIANNAPVGTCLQTSAGVDAKTVPKVAVVRCSVKHWAQVFGYPVLYKAGGKWPGDAAVYAKARKSCSNNIPSLPGYTTRVGWPGKDWWKDPKQTIYAFCLVHRVDDKQFTGGLG